MTNIKPRCLYQDKNDHVMLVLGVTPMCVNFIYLYRSNIYDTIADVNINFLGNDWYACFDRVMSITTKAAEELELEFCEKLTFNEYDKIIRSITQFYMGDIKYCDTEYRFMYSDEYEEIKSKRKISVRISRDDEYNTDEDPVNIDMSESDTAALQVEDDEDCNEYSDNVVADAPPATIRDIVKSAKKLGIDVDSKKVRGRTEYWIDLITQRNPDKPRKGSASKARYVDIDKRTMYKRRWFTIDEVRLIAKINNANSVASKYDCSWNIAMDMVKNAKRILGIEVITKDIKYNFTKYFNEGKSIKDVAEIYPDLPIRIIEINYRKWDINSNIDNNRYVYDKWNEIIDSGDLEVMIDGFFDHTIEEFANEEECTMTCAGNIMSKIYDNLCRNPFVCAGFGKLSFDKDGLINLVSDAINNGSAEDAVTESLYTMTCMLYDMYVETYDHHSDILGGEYDIPSYVIEIGAEDSFLSLIWNRFNRRDIYNKKREDFLTNSQRVALKEGTKEEVALKFMISFNQASNLITTYRKRNKQINKNKG